MLVEKDYPIFFGGTKWYDEVVIQPASDTSKQGKRKAPSRRGYDSVGISPLLSHPELPTPPSLHPSERKFLAPIDESQIPHSGSLPTLCVDFDKWLGNESLLLMRHGESKDFDELAEAQDIQIELNVVVDDENKDADSAIPTSIFDVVEVRESTIANAGRGVFAKRKIPKHTIIGFYFGVPLTEDEFDCMKEKTGQASQYAVRRSVGQNRLGLTAHPSSLSLTHRVPDSLPFHNFRCDRREWRSFLPRNLPFPLHQRGFQPSQHSFQRGCPSKSNLRRSDPRHSRE